jgi:hypothetical protein
MNALHYLELCCMLQNTKTFVYVYLACIIIKPCKGKEIPLQAWTGSEGPRFLNNWHMMVASLSALRTSCLYPPRNIPGTHFCERLSQPQGHSVARKIMSIKNSNETIRNRTCDLPACSAVPQRTVTPCSPIKPCTDCDIVC